MNLLIKQICCLLFFSSFFSFFLIALDFINHLYNPKYPLIFTGKEFFIFFFINILILSIRSNKMKLAFYGLFLLFSTIQLIHYNYFGNLISAYEISLAFSQFFEITETLLSVWNFVLLPVCFSFLLFFIAYLIINKFADTLPAFKYSFPVLLVLFIAMPLAAAQRDDDYDFLPKAKYSALKNFLSSYSLFVGKEIPRKIFSEQKQFEPYTSIKQTPLIQNVVIVMGESLTYEKMSLFGYEKSTTPKLQSLLNDDFFIYKKSFSSGISTDVSLPYFFNTQREPGNLKHLLSNTANLFKLAKEQQYKVHYISTQSSSLLKNYIGKYADIITTLEDFKKTKDYIYDTLLFDYLKTIDLTQRNFIVLHQRASHSPYDKYTPQEFHQFDFDEDKYDSYMLYSYLNSILFTDSLLFDIITYLQKHSQSSTAIFFTADHGELMGDEEDNEIYGHMQLDFATAKVPFIYYGINTPDRFHQKMLSLQDGLSHYEISKVVAQSIGYEIINPNEDGFFFINNVDITGNAGFLEYNSSTILEKL